jgi:hypothetical protein
MVQGVVAGYFTLLCHVSGRLAGEAVVLVAFVDDEVSEDGARDEQQRWECEMTARKRTFISAVMGISVEALFFVLGEVRGPKRLLLREEFGDKFGEVWEKRMASREVCLVHGQ